ncbi:L-rhamnose 1-dehydrogenase (NADP(+)) [Candidatus Lokiarchaeum ossiferum]|uniref:L-rhamnose 1-dehydrogenase (NADP(+)) n=1 Tax=Candidatus Lokiarchaeum ossiferum TaxID=2951803 RepID=A0ABY6HQ62_9ARCH|nr:L-rhamnose 1-dehydrogenase (NADP(+)) [Candidatus Lokiarchaeum sp. B-35]
MASTIDNKTNFIAKNDVKSPKNLLDGKVAIITGSSRGIGKGTAIVFAQQGAKVVINGRDVKACEETAQEIRDMGGEAIACPASITNKEEVDNLVQKTIDTYGKIDILVNNAGTSRDALIHKMDDKLFNFIVDLNLKGTHMMTQAVLPHFRQANRNNEFKKIVNVASITGVTGNFGQSNYAIAKSGVIAYSKAIARELAMDRINVNVVAPGFCETRMTALKKEGDELGMPGPLRNIAISATPFAREGKAGQPEHTGNTILFFSSELSDWLSGQVVTVDGGMYI